MTTLTHKISSGKNVLITAALPYANGDLHVGHIAGAYLPSDIYARYLRLQGVNVRTVCGSDDHGVAMVLAALKESSTPAAVSAKYHARQKAALEGIGINFDIYGATSRNKFHTPLSQKFFKKLFDQGCFTKKSSEQYYDSAKASFLPDRFVRGTCGYCGTKEQNGDQCENCGKELDPTVLKDARSVLSGEPVTLKQTVHWFLDLSKFQAQVAHWLDQAIIRQHTRSYVKGLLAQGLVERSMTRDLDWGIPVPLEDPDAQGKVLYVWFDAPIGYISNSMELAERLDGNPDAANEWWNSDKTDVYHFIGEDNTIFHTIIWIAMLAAEGDYCLPRGVIVNHFLNFQKPGSEVEKMSKSRGTAVWISEYLAGGGAPDVLRYALAIIAPEESRSVFNPADLVARNNSELGATIGNLFQRIIQFTRSKVSPEIPASDPARFTDLDKQFMATLQRCHEEVTADMNDFHFRDAITKLLEFGRVCNRYVDEQAPWKMIKVDPEQTKVSLAMLFNALKFLAVALAPFLPDTTEKMAQMLGLSKDERLWAQASTPLPAGRELIEPMILFPRIEAEGDQK
jgi:methionyl-tRNA synthetase